MTPRTPPNLGAPSLAAPPHPTNPPAGPFPLRSKLGERFPTGAGVTPSAGVPPAYKPPSPLPDRILAFDAENKEYNAKLNEFTVPLSFTVTNISNREVTIHTLHPTCGCTFAKMPAQPWRMAPGEFGEFHLTVDLRGKRGSLSKSVFVDSSEGYKAVYFKVVIPDRPGAMSPDLRERNLQVAAGDRQAVFKSDCAKCHSEPARGKKGHELYLAACSICHDADERASMVPDLKTLAKPTDREFWKRGISKGKPGTLMPAFAQDDGGPLTADQIDSLVDHLLKSMPSRAATDPLRPQTPAVLAD